MPDSVAVIFVRPDAPPAAPEGASPVTPEGLKKALNTFALAMAKEALLDPEERARKAPEIVAFVSKLLAVIDQAVRQWPPCSPAFPSLEDAMAGITPPDRICGECACWSQHYEAWKTPEAPAWWPNAEAVSREELETWTKRQQKPARTPRPVHAAAS
mgnify:CR=1 FL=1